MADKIVTVKLNEDLQRVFEKRVSQVNRIVPESELTISSSVKYGAELFALDIARADVEKKLICPLLFISTEGHLHEKIKEDKFISESDL